MAGPIPIRMGGYGPPSTGFSQSLKRIGDRLAAQFGDRVDIKYVWNIMDFGYKAEDIIWLVESGVLTLGYQSSSYLTDRVPELGSRAASLRQKMFDTRLHSRRYAREFGIDTPEVNDWVWPDARGEGGDAGKVDAVAATGGDNE